MTYQEILQALKSLPREQQDSLIEQIYHQQIPRGRHNITERQKATANERSAARATERTPEETIEGLRKLENFMKFQQERWENMTPEQREASDHQFKILDETLRESRGLGEDWE
jgi:hypothetical protein